MLYDGAGSATRAARLTRVTRRGPAAHPHWTPPSVTNASDTLVLGGDSTGRLLAAHPRTRGYPNAGRSSCCRSPSPRFRDAVDRGGAADSTAIFDPDLAGQP